VDRSLGIVEGNMTTLLTQYGLLIVFVNVLIAQLGFPIPAVPVLIAAGALAADGTLAVSEVFAVAVTTSVAADTLWFAAGRAYGRRVMALLCRLSANAGAFLYRTETRFERWGTLVLLMAKFIPGLSTLAPPLAASTGFSWGRFLVLDAVGAALWAGAAVGAGMALHAPIEGVLLHLNVAENAGPGLLSILLATYIGYRAWERRRFSNGLRAVRVTPGELRHMRRAREPAVIVDLRPRTARYQDPRSIPGAIALNLVDLPDRLDPLPKTSTLIFYCAPGKAAAVARTLIDSGYPHVRPLLGGLDAWTAAKYEVEFPRPDCAG
jgi:membrane protein DedA with SNARE-associated domain/rhodanese-related sulfurtransferase